MKKPLIILAFVLGIFVSGASLVSAQARQPGSTDTTNSSGVDTTNSITPIIIDNPFKDGVGDSIPALFNTLLNEVLIPIGGILCVFGFIFAGFKYVTAQGNPGQIEKANKALLYAAIGTVLLLGSWVISRAICSTINQLGGPNCPTKII